MNESASISLPVPPPAVPRQRLDFFERYRSLWGPAGMVTGGVENLSLGGSSRGPRSGCG